ncbi:flagellar hook-basal body complex protein FliE [Aurantimonas sp. Leaf443]|uniref:flagellar hook-basal body complex protein FliE n=1 Tax=Aurantimonas sp. Leaf443 TaxID=1736378 RepID=UPI000700858C|nr:flagellar hook-basal body complex protein FliE [Aurantimonas sp. Leaf443]KQT86013.1 hypothetical protein ASG48_05340 [Aurantimonas sp. Leaf443]
MISPIDGASARLSTGSLGLSGVSAPSAASFGGAGAVGAPDFASVMKQVASDAVGTLKTSETVSIDAMHGKASTQAVVDAVMNAERTLQTAVTLRDKVVSAYLEISRMAI